MESELSKICVKPSDYVVCEACRHINWYENETCVDCGINLVEHPTYTVQNWIDDEYIYWSEEGYPETEADKLFIEV